MAPPTITVCPQDCTESPFCASFFQHNTIERESQPRAIGKRGAGESPKTGINNRAQVINKIRDLKLIHHEIPIS